MVEDWVVYIVKCADSSLYTGICKDLNRRVATHNLGKGARYTRNRLPVEVVYQEPAANRSLASRREYEIKQLSRSQKLSLISSNA